MRAVLRVIVGILVALAVSSCTASFSSEEANTSVDSNRLEATLKHEHIRPLSKQFQTPYRYIGMSASKVARLFHTRPNKVGSFDVDTSQVSASFETGGTKAINYVSIGFKDAANCTQHDDIYSRNFLAAAGMSAQKLRYSEAGAGGSHIYQDDVHRLQVSIGCLYDGDNISLSLSRKYYEQ